MRILVALVMLSVIVGLSIAASYDICWPQYVSCSESCCSNAGGSLTETSDGVSCDASSSGLAQYHTCDNPCVAAELNCLAPGSSCASQYTSCVNSCGATSGSCVSSCSDSAFDCTDAARSNSSSSSSGCCGSGLILLLAASGGLLLARRYRGV